jgi:hypothetical protein
MPFPAEKNTLIFEVQHGPCGNGLKKLGLVDQTVMDSVEGEFEAVGDTEFIENIMQVVLHRLFADKKLFPDFAVAESLGYELYNFFLAVTK